MAHDASSIPVSRTPIVIAGLLLATGLHVSARAQMPLAQPPCCTMPAAAHAEPLRFSAEYRTRLESFQALDYGIDSGAGAAPAYTAIAHRARLGADWRAHPQLRLFAQVAAADQTGRLPRPRPFDESRPDLAQGFAEARLPLGGSQLTAKLGRQELALDNRLIGLRDGVILRRSYDGLRLDAPVAGVALTGFLLQPVATAAGGLDDAPIAGERFSGVSARLPTRAQGEWMLFAFDRQRRNARFANGTGGERRLTLGVGHDLKRGAWTSDVQAALQRGHVGAQRVLAWGGSAQLLWQPDANKPLRLGLGLGAASGDGAAGDGKLSTFDPLYPNIAALSDAPLTYFSNQMHAQLAAENRIGPVLLRGTGTLLARQRKGDALYAAGARQLGAPREGQASAALYELSARWRPHPRLELYASALQAQALGGVKAAGGDDSQFYLLQLTTGF